MRFIYCYPTEWYLTLDKGRDTLDFPVDEELDLAGWALRKALRLLHGSNAALFEWLQSPVVYHEALDFWGLLAPLLPTTFNLKAGLHHYLGQLRRGVEEDLVGEDVRLKRLFYALRSALAAPLDSGAAVGAANRVCAAAGAAAKCPEYRSSRAAAAQGRGERKNGSDAAGGFDGVYAGRASGGPGGAGVVAGRAGGQRRGRIGCAFWNAAACGISGVELSLKLLTRGAVWDPMWRQ